MAAPAAASPRSVRSDADEKLFELFCEWYAAPRMRLADVHALRDEQMRTLWTTLWFAKGELTAPLDKRLHETYGACFDVFAEDAAAAAAAAATADMAPAAAPAAASSPPPPPALPRPLRPLPQPPAGLSAAEQLEWTFGLMVLCDQVSRNAFRGTARAYATDALACRIADAPGGPRARFDELPVALRMSVVLVFVHSEDAADVAVVDALLARLRPALEQVCPFVWASLSAIAGNHKDRMHLFGRVPERNRCLGRASTLAEEAYMAATGAPS
jgi:uncharacterized protein (DUF924 family)